MNGPHRRRWRTRDGRNERDGNEEEEVKETGTEGEGLRKKRVCLIG